MAARKKKKTAAPKPAPRNPLKVVLTLKNEGAVDGGRSVYSVWIAGPIAGGFKAAPGSITAKNETEARAKAKRYLRAALKG